MKKLLIIFGDVLVIGMVIGMIVGLLISTFLFAFAMNDLVCMSRADFEKITILYDLGKFMGMV